jgi:uncharacterized lipoprotein YddW (UPF0748 family)
MTQLAIVARDNKNLFSNYYLDNKIKNNPEWMKDGLIDRIVYKLYGLTEDEIKIVEGSISGEKQNEEPKS